MRMDCYVPQYSGQQSVGILQVCVWAVGRKVS